MVARKSFLTEEKAIMKNIARFYEGNFNSAYRFLLKYQERLSLNDLKRIYKNEGEKYKNRCKHKVPHTIGWLEAEVDTYMKPDSRYREIARRIGILASD